MISLIAFVLALLTLGFPNSADRPVEPASPADDTVAANPSHQSADLAAILGDWEATISFPGGEERTTTMGILPPADPTAFLGQAKPRLVIGPGEEALEGTLTCQRTDAGLHLASDARGAGDRAILQGTWIDGPAGGHLEGTLFGVEDGRLFHWRAVRHR